MSDYDILLLRVEHQDAEIDRLREDKAGFWRDVIKLEEANTILRAALEEITNGNSQSCIYCQENTKIARKALANE